MYACEKVVAGLKERGMDAIVVASPENVLYLTGARLLVHRLVPERESFVLFTVDGRSTLVTVHGDADYARRVAKVDAVRGYDRKELPAQVLSRVILETGLGRSRIGLESKFVRTSDFLDAGSRAHSRKLSCRE